MNWTSLFGLSYFTALIYSLSKEPSWYFFHAHPLLMGLGFPLLFLEGILALKNSSLVFSPWKSTSRNLHYWSSVIAVICWNVGIWVIYENKELNKKEHFKSYHSWVGIFVFLLVPVQMILGRKFWVVGDWVTRWIPDSAIHSVRLAHKEFGKWIAWLASIAVVLASYSNWVSKKSQVEQFALMSTSWMLFVSCFANLFSKQ